MPAAGTPGEAIPDARRAFYAWRGFMRKRASTDLDALEHALVFEGFTSGYTRGVRDRFALELEVAGALNTIDRFASLLQTLVLEREAVLMVGSDIEEESK